MRILLRSVLLLLALGVAALAYGLLSTSGLPAWAQGGIFYAVVFGEAWGLSLWSSFRPPARPMLLVVIVAVAFVAVGGVASRPTWDEVLLNAGIAWFIAGWYVVWRRAHTLGACG